MLILWLSRQSSKGYEKADIMVRGWCQVALDRYNGRLWIDVRDGEDTTLWLVSKGYFTPHLPKPVTYHLKVLFYSCSERTRLVE